MQVKQSLGYGCDPQKYMFGMCEEFEGSLDKGADPMVTIDLIDRLGAKSMRIWMHHKRLLRRKGDKDELEWKPDVFARYRKYVEELARRGIRIGTGTPRRFCRHASSLLPSTAGLSSP